MTRTTARKSRIRPTSCFCGDPELNDAAPRLSSAIEARLDRLSDRRLAIEENAEWIKNRNASCGIFGNQAVPDRDIDSVRKCLLKETEERIAILTNPNFDCLAADTTAGMLICSEPELVLAAQELNDRALALIAGLKDNARKDAFAEYARWTRDRDRKCDLVGKDNVPLDELSSSGSCLADYMKEKTAEMAAAKGDPRRVFGLHPSSPLPDADAVDLCVTQIHSANTCENFLSVSRVYHIDDEVAEQQALVTAEVEMIVLSPFAVCSPVASELYRHLLGFKDGQGHVVAFIRKQGQFRGHAQNKDREIVQVPQIRQRRLALRHHLASTG